MVIINAALKGENTYDITTGDSSVYRVSAYDIDRALDIVGDYIEQHTAEKCGYFTGSMFRVIAEYHGYANVREYAKHARFIECGSNKIYIELKNIQEVTL